MAEYSRQDNLSTYTINQSLLKSIEEYFIQDVPKLLNIDVSKNTFLTSITIYDSYGQEKLNSISEYKFPLFKDDISGITMELEIKNSNDDEVLKVLLRFGKDHKSSDLSIKLTHEFAKEKVLILNRGIFEILEGSKNFNWLLYPPELLTALLGLTGFVFGALSLQATNTQIKFLYATAFFSMIIYFFAFSYLKRYCQFETNRQQYFDKWFNWFILGLATFIVFATFATSLRKQLFGF